MRRKIGGNSDNNILLKFFYTRYEQLEKERERERDGKKKDREIEGNWLW